MAQDTKEALERLTDSLNKSNSLLETIKGAISQQIGASEGLKTAMVKSNTLNQGKVYDALERVADLPGRFDKVLQSFGKFMQEGLGSQDKQFLGVLSQIETLGLDMGPFLQLTRGMNNTMNASQELQTKALTQLMNIADLTEANPELLATALNKHQQTFTDAAGIYGPQFANDLRAVMTTIAASMKGGGAELEPLLNVVSKFIGETPEQKALRARLGLPENLEGMGAEDLMSKVVYPLLKSVKEGMFQGEGSATIRALLGETFSFQAGDFAILDKAAAELGSVGELLKLMQTSTRDLRVREDAEKKLSATMDKLANAFFSIFTPSMEALGNVMGPNNLGGKVVDLAQTIADWISGELLGLTNKAIAIFSEFEANGGITQMQEKIAEAGSLVSQIWEGAQTAVVATWDFFTQGGIQKAWNTFKENLELWTEQFKSVLSQWGHNALVYGGVIVRNIFWTMIDAFAIGAEFIFLKIKHAWQDWNPLGVVGDVAEIAWDTAFGAAEMVLGTAGGLLKTVGKGVQGEWHNPLTTVMEVGGRGLDRVSGWVEHGSIAGERNARQEEEMDA